MASTGKTITVDDVDKLTFGESLKLIGQLQLAKDRELNESTAKLLLKDYLSGGGAGKQKVQKAIDADTTSAAVEADLALRTRLRGLYKRAGSYFNKLPTSLKDELDTLFRQYQSNVSTYTEELRTSQCVLLFAGEMGAGKTSLINLLLGRDILPTSNLRCTAAIVEISYGPEPTALVHYKDDSSGKAAQVLKFSCPSTEKCDQFLTNLEAHIVKRDEETDESPYEKIELKWPLDMLKGGVVIVDSPGVGGSQTLPQHLVDYMQRAFGFIYVIDMTGGVHRQRLGQLLLKADEASDGFQPETTLFVCNRWDAIPASESEKVLQSLTEKLSMIVPGVVRERLYPISVKQSKEQLAYGQVSPLHTKLIHGIRNLLPQSMKGKLRFYYRYLSSLLKRSLYSLRVRQNLHRETVANMKKDLQSVENRLRKLERNAQSSLDDMRTKMTKETVEAGFKAVQHFDAMKTRIHLLTWSERDCPPKEKSWQNIQKNANLAIAEKIALELNRWEQDVKLVSKMQNEVVALFQKEFQLLDNEIEQVQALLLEDMNGVRSFTQSVKKNLDPKKQLKLQAEHMRNMDTFMSLGAAITSRFNLSAKDPLVKSVFKEYNADPCKAMAKATEMYLALLNPTEIVPALTKYFDRFVKGIDRVGAMMPEMMKADQMLLKELDRDLESKEQLLREFPSMSQECADIQGHLDMFYVKKLLIWDFTADQLKVLAEEGNGSFATVYRARFTPRSGTPFDVAIKEPKVALKVEDVTDVLLEEAMLRDLNHDNFVKYYGVCRKGQGDNIKLVMVMEYCPITLKKQRIDNGSNSPSKLGANRAAQGDSVEVITNYLVQICKGLKFLHNRAIVHRDIKPANVLLTRDSRVKIADLGLAKKVKDIVTQGIGTPVYMAPEVLLHFTKYDTKVDIYSLGMVMWELWYGEDMAKYASSVFHEGLKIEIERGWRPSLTIREAPGDFWATLMTQCWEKDPARRPTADHVRQRLINFYKEFRARRQGDSGLGSKKSEGSSSSSSSSSFSTNM